MGPALRILDLLRRWGYNLGLGPTQFLIPRDGSLVEPPERESRVVEMTVEKVPRVPQWVRSFFPRHTESKGDGIGISLLVINKGSIQYLRDRTDWLLKA